MILAALRAIWAVVTRIPAWIWAPLLALALGWGAHEWHARQAAQIDAQAARTALATSEAAAARDRAVAAESAAEAVTNSLRAQRDHATRQQAILDDLEIQKSAAVGWQQAYNGLVRGRDDAARADRLRSDIAARIAADAARDRAATDTNAAASACARRAAGLGDLLAEGAGLVGEGANLVDGLRAQLAGAARIIANDRAMISSESRSGDTSR